MPWNNQNGGGGWQGGGNRGPWGQGPSGGGTQPPDLEELIRRGQDRLKNIFPSGQAGGRGPFIVIGLVVLGLLVWSSFYRVDTNQQGIVLRFGEYVRWTPPGLHMKLPYPIETVATPVVTEVNKTNIGIADARTRDSRGQLMTASIPEESQMLTGDENIVDIQFSVFWRIKEAPNYLFNVQNPAETIKAVAESAMREVVGQSNIQVLLTTGRDDAQTKVGQLIQDTLDGYKAGIEITEVKLQNVDPPTQVIDAFRDVQAARADQERLRNEAEAYANTVIPKARGEAEKINQAASAYREQTIAEAQGQASRFLAVYNEYKNAKNVTRKRMFLETMERVFGSMDKIIIDKSAEGSQGVVPYLPLNELNKSRSKPEVSR
mgnify:CR=1 FL=1